MIINEIIFATKNEGKLKEIRRILGECQIRVLSMGEAGIDPPIDENGSTFKENALIKARTVALASGLPAMADDSGLVIDALGGEPGIYSARYLGEDTSYEIKNRILLERMEGTEEEKRSARFVCAAVLYLPDTGDCLCTQGVMEGRIAYEAAGENGFGYDPIFYLPSRGCTSAQLTPEEKNEISHRGKALRAMADEIARYCAEHGGSQE